MRRWGALVVGIAVAAGIVGCVGAPGSGSGSTARTSATASAETARPSATPGARVTGIEILGDHVRFLAGDRELRALAYDAPIATALAAFTGALGPQTSTKELPATNHTAPTTEHGFGAVRILEPHDGGTVEHDPVIHPVWSISARAAQVGDVAIGTVGGLRVGSSVEDVAGWDQPGRLGTLTLSDHVVAELLVAPAPGYPLVPDGERGAYGTLAIAEVYPGPITVLTAPSQHGGA